MSSELTKRQALVLHVVEQHGPVTAGDVDYHGFTASAASARALLARLEDKRCVEAVYTGHDRGRGRAFVVTERGTAALRAYFDAASEGQGR